MNIDKMSYNQINNLVGKKVRVLDHQYHECKELTTIEKVICTNKILFRLEGVKFAMNPIHLESV